MPLDFTMVIPQKYKYALKIATLSAESLETNACKYSADLDMLLH